MEPTISHVQLIRYLKQNSAEATYFLHTIATFSRPAFKADGYIPVFAMPGEGKPCLQLRVHSLSQSPLPRVYTPVVHTVCFGATSPCPAEADSLLIQWIDEYGVVLAEHRIGGGTTTTQIASDDDTRPFPVAGELHRNAG